MSSLGKSQAIFFIESKLHANKPEIEGIYEGRRYERYAYSFWVHERRDFNHLHSKYRILSQFSMNEKLKYSTFFRYSPLEGIKSCTNFNWALNRLNDFYMKFPERFLHYSSSYAVNFSFSSDSDDEVIIFHQSWRFVLLLVLLIVVRESMKAERYDCSHYSWRVCGA